jgi:hypothetical protein
MSREAIHVGAFTWSRIQRLNEPDETTHWQRCDVERLKGCDELQSSRPRSHCGQPFLPVLALANDAKN